MKNNNFKCDKELKNFQSLNRIMHNAVNYMFNAIDENNVSDFKLWLLMWHNAKTDLLKNKYNECGHALCDEILQFAKENNIIDEYGFIIAKGTNIS